MDPLRYVPAVERDWEGRGTNCHPPTVPRGFKGTTQNENEPVSEAYMLLSVCKESRFHHLMFLK